MAQTILIVEDNELNMKLFRDLLEAQGYNVLQTRDGMQALDLARAERPDLISVKEVARPMSPNLSPLTIFSRLSGSSWTDLIAGCPSAGNRDKQNF
jgi:CheY-like chemotaxis protein